VPTSKEKNGMGRGKGGERKGLMVEEGKGERERQWREGR